MAEDVSVPAVEYPSISGSTRAGVVEIIGAPSENVEGCQLATSHIDFTINQDECAAFISSQETLVILQCQHCDFRTSNRHAMNVHSLGHLGRDVKVFECPDCEYTTKYKYNLKTHLKWHLELSELEEGEVFSCEKCDYKSQCKQNLQVHLQKHEPTKPFACQACDFTTVYKHSLLHHVRSKHAKLRPYQCSQCSFASARWQDLKIHEARHTPGADFLCIMCNFKTTQKQAFEAHVKGHEIADGPGPFQCDSCPYKGKTKALLRAHMRRHFAENRHACHLCDYKTTTKYNLKRHVERHHAERPLPERTFTCDTCGYVTTYKHSLKRHMATHAMIKPYRCGHCDYSAVSMSQMRVHIAKHTGIMPFACTECEYRTANKQHLVAHAAKHSNTLLCCNRCDFHTRWKGQMKLHLKSHTLSTFTVAADGSYSLNWHEVHTGGGKQGGESQKIDGHPDMVTTVTEKLQRISEALVAAEPEVAAQEMEDAVGSISLSLIEESMKDPSGQDITLVTLSSLEEAVDWTAEEIDPVSMSDAVESLEGSLDECGGRASTPGGDDEQLTATSHC